MNLPTVHGTVNCLNRLNGEFTQDTPDTSFDFLINFGELDFDSEADHIASGGYGKVYKGKW